MDKSRSNRIFLWLLFALLLAGLSWYAWWFYSNFEEYTEQVRVDISPQAKRNPFLAAERFLQEMGVSVNSRSGRDIFNHPLTDNDTILLAGNSRFFLERNHERLLEWVNNGGSLILIPALSWGEDEESYPLFKQFEIELRYSWQTESDGLSESSADSCEVKPGEASSDAGKAQNTEATNTDSENKKKVVADSGKSIPDIDEDKPDTVTFHTSEEGDYLADFRPDRYIRAETEKADVLVGSAEHPHLIGYPLGNGHITVLSDMELFDTRHIGKQDHAYMLYKLVHGSGAVWLFYSADMPSLLTLLWNRVPYVVLLACVALLLAVWWLLANSGPKLIPHFNMRRNLMEHLDASARYSWRVDKARRMFADNRSAVEQSWRRRHPQLNSLDEEQRCEWISEQSGVFAAAIRRSLYGDISTEQDFIRATSVLQHLATEVGRYKRNTTDN